jgi:hypothetical protein
MKFLSCKEANHIGPVTLKGCNEIKEKIQSTHMEGTTAFRTYRSTWRSLLLPIKQVDITRITGFLYNFAEKLT